MKKTVNPPRLQDKPKKKTFKNKSKSTYISTTVFCITVIFISSALLTRWLIDTQKFKDQSKRITALNDEINYIENSKYWLEEENRQNIEALTSVLVRHLRTIDKIDTNKVLTGVTQKYVWDNCSHKHIPDSCFPIYI
jgi:hypothetical protein